MELGNTVEILVGVVTALGGLSLIKFLFFMNPEKRKAAAEADIKEVEKEERKLGVMEQLVKSLQERIEQQDQKIKELNNRLDKLPKRTYCRLKKLAAGEYDAFYDNGTERKEKGDEDNGVFEKPD